MLVRFLGYNLFDGDVQDCAQEIASISASGARDCRILACLNPHSYVLASDDAVFRAALKSADWLVPDGIGVVLAARWLGLPVRERIAGPDVFMAVLEKLDQRKGSVFFLGASETTLAKIKERLSSDYPGVVVTGTYSPPFKPQFSDDDNAAMVAAINAVQPDVLWVGMTAPKQEKWLAEHRAKLQVGAAGAVGAAFDFYAGTVKRSPSVFRAYGLEWLPRLMRQPRRLWRRMIVSAPVFLADVRRERRRRAHHTK